MNNKALLLHLGLSKTGSSTLQKALFRKHPQIYYLGKFANKGMSIRKCQDDLTYRILNPVLWDLDEPMDMDATLSLFQDKLMPKIPEDQVLVGSWENLGNRSIEHHREILNRSKAIFGSCRLLVTLRNPLTRLLSDGLQNSSR